MFTKLKENEIRSILFSFNFVNICMSLEDIVKIQEKRRQREIAVYKNVYERARHKINLYAKNGSAACFYKIPNFIFGYPLINIPKTKEYILGRLNHEGFIAIPVDDPETIYVSWELSTSKRKEMKRESKISTEMAEKDDLTNTLFKIKSSLGRDRNLKS